MTWLAGLFSDMHIIVRPSNKWDGKPLSGFEQKNDMISSVLTWLF